MAGKATAAPVASLPEKPVSKVSGVAVVPADVTATNVLAVCVFCAGVMLAAPITTSATASGVSLPPKQAASATTIAALKTQRVGLPPKSLSLFI
jgi:histone acetyltransferase (RNA polymerase elongator complex component)